MRKFLFAVALLVSTFVVAQTPAPTSTFSLSAQAVALPGGKSTVAATVMGGTFALGPQLSLRQDSVVAPGNALTAYFGGFQYALPTASKFAQKHLPNLDGNKFQFYVTASAGAVRANEAQHYGFLAGGGINYDPSDSGHFNVNLVEVRYAKLPGYANNTAIVSSGFKVNF